MVLGLLYLLQNADHQPSLCASKAIAHKLSSGAQGSGRMHAHHEKAEHSGVLVDRCM